MTDGFAHVWVEKRGDRYYTIVETGDGKRTTSPPFRTERAANARAEKALAVIQRLHPEAEVLARDQKPGAKLEMSAADRQAASEARHERNHEEPRA